MAIVRINHNTYENGEEYLTRLDTESQRDFKLLLALLSSYWQSTIDGPNYAREIKAMAKSLARIRLSLEDIQLDQNYSTTRTEFLYQVLTSALFPGPQGAPNLQDSDVDFRDFLNQIVLLYFAGSIPSSIKTAVELITGGEVILHQDYLEAREPGSAYDISDEFSMDIDVLLGTPGSINTILADKNVRLLLRIIRPAHTLFRLKWILQDSYSGASTYDNPAVIQDSLTSLMSCYSYEDFRKFVDGLAQVDPLGVKQSIQVTGEDHSADF